MILGIHELHPGVLWENEGSTPAAIQQVTYTLLSNVIIHNVPIAHLELHIGTKDGGSKTRGYFTRTQFEYIKAAEGAATVLPFTYRGLTRNVFVKAGSVSLMPKKEIESVMAEDAYTGTITLQEI